MAKIIPLEPIICPHCWKDFVLEDIRWVSVDNRLLGDPRRGENENRCFTPTRYSIDGNAIDAFGGECTKLVCPRCHLPIARPLIHMKTWFTSIAGAQASGKSYLLAAMIKSLRDSCHKFGVGFNDADGNANQLVRDYEKEMFYNPTNDPIELLKTQRALIGDWYDNVTIEGQEHLYPKPFLYSLKLDSRHPFHQHADQIDRVLCLYDNSGESFLPGTDDEAFAPVTRHMAISKALFFCFDPTQEPAWRKAAKMPAAATEGLKGRVTEPQEVIFTEMLERIATHQKARKRARETQEDKPLIIILSKFDTWCDLLGRKRLRKPWNPTENGSYVFDIEMVERVSDKLRSILQETSPSFVHRAEEFTDKLLFVPVSATGMAPDKNNKFHVDEIAPMWCEVPLLATLVKWGGPGHIIPSFKRSQQPS